MNLNVQEERNLFLVILDEWPMVKLCIRYIILLCAPGCVCVCVCVCASLSVCLHVVCVYVCLCVYVCVCVCV